MKIDWNKIKSVGVALLFTAILYSFIIWILKREYTKVEPEKNYVTVDADEDLETDYPLKVFYKKFINRY